MRTQTIALAALAAIAVFVLHVCSAQASNARSWVGSNGADGNPCTRSSPCATFSYALGQTNAGGEVNCVDQAEFGGFLNITKAITIDCEGVQGRIAYANPGNTAIVVGAAATDAVVLRGLDISGEGVTGVGVDFRSGAALHIEKCVIHDFSSPTGAYAWGIYASLSFNPVAELFVSDTVLENNGSTSYGGGILIQPGTSNGVTKVVLNRLEVRNNYFGIKAEGTGTGGNPVLNMTVRDSVSSGNQSNGIVGTSRSNGPAIVMMVDHSSSSHNATAGFGVIADGPRTFMALTNSTISGNLNGIGYSNGGTLISYQNNNIIFNSADGVPSAVMSAK